MYLLLILLMAGIGFSSENWDLNSYFGHIYVINLSDTSESNGKYARKMKHITEELRKTGCNRFERIEATQGASLGADIWGRFTNNCCKKKTKEELDKMHQGQAGCYMSHYRAIKDANENYNQACSELSALQKKVKNERSQEAKNLLAAAKAKVDEYSCILILEDDSGFGFLETVSNQSAVVKLQGSAEAFKEAMEELPKDWDMFYLVSSEKSRHPEKLKSSPHKPLKRLRYGILANAVAIRAKAYPMLLKELGRIDQPGKKLKPVDHVYARLHKKLKAFAPIKPLAYQAPFVSDITGIVRNEPWAGW